MYFFQILKMYDSVLVFILSGFVLGLCSGRKFALLTAGPFDVLLQSLPIAVSSHLICSRLFPSPSLLICSLPFLASCVPLMVNSYTRSRTHGCLRSQLERQYYCAVVSPTRKLISLLTFLCSNFTASHLL